MIIQLFIKSKIIKNITIYVELDEHISNIKNRIENITGFPKINQLLIYNNIIMEDNHTLNNYNIINKSIIILASNPLDKIE